MLNRIRALEKEYGLITDPFKKVDFINKFAWEFMDSMVYTELCREKIEEAQKILTTIDYPLGKADLLSSLAFYYWAKTDHTEVKRIAEEAIPLYHKIGSNIGLTAVLTLVTYGYVSAGNYGEAFKCVNEAINYSKDLPGSVQKAWAYYGLAIIYFETKDYEECLRVIKRAGEIVKEINYTYGIARDKTFTASVYINQGRFEEAEDALKESIVGFREIGHDVGLSRSLNDLGVICRKKGKFTEADKYLTEAYDIRSNVKHSQGMITTAYELGELKNVEKKPEEAIEWLTIALEVSKKINARAKEAQIEKALAEAHKQLDDYKNAFAHLSQYVNLFGQVSGQEATQRLKQIETRVATEKAEKEAEIERLKNVELKHAHDVIADKNKEIVDSINYAWRIQSALLASDKILRDNLINFFVLLKPKDIVSGDFYWATKQGDRFYIAVCDSTGHGVPGAFMSILNANYMHEAINERGIVKPNEVFNHVRNKLVENISQDGQQDGMDGILISVGNDGAYYAAAYNSPILVKNGQVIQLEADKMPVGKGEKGESFTLRTLQGKPGDMLYLYTDGYADQFGGPHGKKYKHKTLEQFLTTIADLPLDEQKGKLDKNFMDWKGNLEQVDDVLIMGIRVVTGN